MIPCLFCYQSCNNSAVIIFAVFLFGGAGPSCPGYLPAHYRAKDPLALYPEFWMIGMSFHAPCMQCWRLALEFHARQALHKLSYTPSPFAASL